MRRSRRPAHNPKQQHLRDNGSAAQVTKYVQQTLMKHIAHTSMLAYSGRAWQPAKTATPVSTSTKLGDQVTEKCKNRISEIGFGLVTSNYCCALTCLLVGHEGSESFGSSWQSPSSLLQDGQLPDSRIRLLCSVALNLTPKTRASKHVEAYRGCCCGDVCLAAQKNTENNRLSGVSGQRQPIYANKATNEQGKGPG